MRTFDAEAVHAALPYPALIEALRAAHLGAIPLSNVVVQADPGGGDNVFVTLPGWLPGGLIVVKMVGVFPRQSCDDPAAALGSGFGCRV